MKQTDLIFAVLDFIDLLVLGKRAFQPGHNSAGQHNKVAVLGIPHISGIVALLRSSFYMAPELKIPTNRFKLGLRRYPYAVISAAGTCIARSRVVEIAFLELGTSRTI